MEYIRDGGTACDACTRKAANKQFYDIAPTPMDVPGFKPAGHFSAGDVEYGTVLFGGTVSFRVKSVKDDDTHFYSGDVAVSVADALNWSLCGPDLYAYAKSQKLLDDWKKAKDSGDIDLTHRLEVELTTLLKSMGLNDGTPDPQFFDKFLTSAIARAEGTQ